MRLTVLGGCGAWPEPGQACSGYLVEHDGFRLVSTWAMRPFLGCSGTSTPVRSMRSISATATPITAPT